MAGYEQGWSEDDEGASPPYWKAYFGVPKAPLDSIVIRDAYATPGGHFLRRLRDYHGTYFLPHLPQRLLDVATDIELRVNGWVLTKVQMKEAIWRDTNLRWGMFLQEPIGLLAAGGPSADGRGGGVLWRIDLMERVPKYVVDPVKRIP